MEALMLYIRYSHNFEMNITAGGALIKYGSLLSSVPFTPSPSMALSIVILPPLAFSIWMLAQDASGTANDES